MNLTDNEISDTAKKTAEAFRRSLPTRLSWEPNTALHETLESLIQSAIDVELRKQRDQMTPGI